MVGILWTISFYTSIRFGVRDALTRSAASFALIGTLAVGVYMGASSDAGGIQTLWRLASETSSGRFFLRHCPAGIVSHLRSG